MISNKVTHFDGQPSMMPGVQSPFRPSNSKECMVAAGLDFEVARSSLYLLNDDDGTQIPVDNKFQAIRRMDTNEVLGVVGQSYHPIQNESAFSILDYMENVTFGRAGYFGSGATCFIQVDLNEERDVLPGDPIKSYALVRTNHSGKKAVSFILTPIRVICQNTLRAALNKHDGRITVRHDSQQAEQIEEAKQLIVWAKQNFGNYHQVFADFAKKEMTHADLRKYVESVIKPSRQKAYMEAEFNLDNSQPYSLENPYQDKDDPKAIDKIMELMQSSSIRAKEGTLWGGFNAITEYLDHGRNFRAGSSTQMESHFGDSKLKDLAMKNAVAIMKRMAVA